MAINKKLIHFKTFENFNSQKLSANEENTKYTLGIDGEVLNGTPDILYQSIVWIKDAQKQWTHGQLYDGSSDTYTTEFTVSDLFSISEDSPLTINKEALVNAVLSDKIIMIPYQDNKGCYVVSIDAFDEEIFFNIHVLASVVSFVIYPNEPINEITIEDIFMTNFQEALISGENIKTINGEDIIGDGSDLELATKDELSAKADDSSVVHTEGDESIRGTKTFYAGPKFLSSGDANSIKFGTDTRINVDNLDGTTNTILGFIRQQFTVNSKSYPLYLYGQQERPKYNNSEELALLSDVNEKQDTIVDLDIIRDGASKGATALQSYTEQYKGTVTGVKINGETKNPSSGVVDLGYINKQLSTSTSSSMALSPNIYYRNTSTSLSALTITLDDASNSNIINEYFVEFTTSSSGTTVSLPSTIKWANGEIPTFEARTTYQISIVNNLGVVTKFE